MSAKNKPPRLWWERGDLSYRKDRLFLGNRDLLEFAQSVGTPAYLYSSARIKENFARLAQGQEPLDIDHWAKVSATGSQIRIVLSFSINAFRAGKCTPAGSNPTEAGGQAESARIPEPSFTLNE